MLSGKTILVTGGARRIGLEIVRTLASANARVVIHYNRSEKDATMLAESIQAEGFPKPCVVQQDLSVLDAGISLFRKTLDLTDGQLDGVVNSASFYEPTPVDFQKETMDHVVTPVEYLHVESPRQLIHCLASMPGVSVKNVVNILDTRITSDDPLHALYLHTKKQLAKLTIDTAVELAPRIRINAVAPGAVLAEENQLPSDFERLANFNPLQGLGNPHDLAKCVLFLLSTDFITGQILFYDGGYHLKHRKLTDGYHSY